MRYDIGTDDPRVRVRAGKSSRPRTKVRPDWSREPLARVIGVDRGRYTLRLEDEGIRIFAVRAKELRRGCVIMGDLVRVTGDLSGRTDTLARIVAVEERTSVLRRSLEDAPEAKGEKAIVANAELMCIVVALADPPPRTGMIDRCLVAAYEAGLEPLLCLTKADLASPDELVNAYSPFALRTLVTRSDTPQAWLSDMHEALRGRFSVLVGHSGVGKSTLMNALVPEANRAVGQVNEVTGRGRHTSTSSQAFALPEGGWIVDTPGVRSFGLGHVDVSDVLGVFPELAEVTQFCLPLCSHALGEPSCAIDAWIRGDALFTAPSPCERARRSALAASLRRLLKAVATAEAAAKAAR